MNSQRRDLIPLWILLCGILIWSMIIFYGFVSPTDTEINGWPNYLSIEIDPMTDCQYLVVKAFLSVPSGITPRLDENGNPMCGDTP